MPILLIQVWFFLLVAPIVMRWVLNRWRAHPSVARVRWILRAMSVTGLVVLVVATRPFVAAFAPVYPVAFTLLTVLPAALFAWPRASRGERALRASFAATAVLAFGLGMWMVHFNQQYSFESDCAPIQADRRNRLLTSVCQPDWAQRIGAIVGPETSLNPASQSRTIFVAPDPRFVYTACGLEGSLERVHPLLRVDRATGAIDRSQLTSGVVDGSCDRDSARCIVLLSAESRYLVIDDRTGATVHEGQLPIGPRFVSIHGTSAIVGLSGPPNFCRIDLVSGAVTFPSDDDTVLLRSLGKGGGMACLGAEPGADDTFFAFEYPMPMVHSLPSLFAGRDLRVEALVGGRRGPLGRTNLSLDHFDFAPLSTLDRVLALDLALSIVPDRRRNEILLVSPMEGAVIAHDFDTLAFRWRLPVGAGIRMADLDRERGRLYVGNYASGWLSVVDLERRAVVDRIYVGRVVRQVRLDPATHHVLTASRAAFLEVDPG